MSNLLLMAAMKGVNGGGSSSPTSDANFSNVAMLLHGEGTNGVGAAPFVASTSPCITKIGTVVEGSVTPYSQSYSANFPGTKYFLLPASTAFGFGTGDFTIESWIYQTQYNSNNAQWLDLRASTNSTALAIGFDGSGHMYYLDGPASAQVNSTAVSALNVWNHIALSRTSGVWRLFLNGTQVYTSTNSDNLGTNQPAYIGTAINGTQYSLYGYISNLRIVNGTSLYTTSSFTPPTGPLTAITGTTFLAFQNSYFVDNSTNNITVSGGSGGVTTSTFGPFAPVTSYSPTTSGGSAWFDGSTGKLSSTTSSLATALSFGSGNFTVECWVNTSSVTNGTMIDTRTSSTNGWFFVFSSGNIYFGNSSTNISLTSAAQANTWVHVAYSRQGTTGRCFVNGVLTNTVTDSFSYTAQQMLLGAGYSGVYLAGYLTDVRISNTAVYTTAFKPNTIPLTSNANTVMLYNGQTASTSGVYDSVGQQNWITAGTTQISTAASKFGTGSMVFDASNGSWLQASQVPVQWGSNNWTIETWLNPLVATQNAGLFTQRTTTGGFCPIAIATDGSGNFNVKFSTNGTSFTTMTTTTIPAANTWGHFAVVRNGTTVTAYWNGSSIGTAAISGALMTSSVGYGIGCDPMLSTGSFTYKGYMDDFRITMGVARYTGSTYTVPTSAFGNSSAADSNWNSVVALMHFDGANGAANSSVTATFVTSTTASLSLTKTGVVTEGSVVPYGTNWGTYFPAGSYLTYGAATTASLGANAFAIEGWFNFSSLPATTGSANAYALWQKGRAATSNFEATMGLMLASGNYQLMFQSSSNGTTVVTANSNNLTLSPNVWYHMAITSAGSNGIVNFWLNGANIGSVSTGVSSIFAGTGLASIANNNNGSSPTWAGYISNMRVTIGSQVYSGAFTPSTTPLPTTASTNLLACSSNTFIDLSTNAWTLTTVSSPTVTHFNPFGSGTAYSVGTLGGSASFDGSTGYLLGVVGTANAFASGDFTAEAWVNTSTTPASQYFIDNRTSSSTTGWSLGFGLQAAGKFGWYYGSGSAVLQDPSTTDFPTGSWNHVAYSRKNGFGRLFLNGKMVASAADATVYTTSGSVYLASMYTQASTGFLNGMMSDVRVVNGTALYTTNFTPTTASEMSSVPNTAFWYRAQGASSTGIFDNAMLNSVQPVNNSTVSTTQKKFGNSSLYFDGTTSAGVYATDAPSLNFGSGNFTIECWIYPTAYTVGSSLFGKRSSSSTYGSLVLSWVSNGGILGAVASTNGTAWTSTATSTTSTALNAWSHVALVRNGTSFVLYINGVSVASTTISGSLYSASTPFVVGGSAQTYSGGSTPWAGYIDDFRITYGIARYTSAFTPPTVTFPDK